MHDTHTTSVLGTPEFMAPELYEEHYGTEVDIYAFGMAVLEMLTREMPYKECQNPAQIYRKVMSGQYPQALDRVGDPQVRNFIIQCIDSRRKRPTAEELLNSDFMKDLKSENNEQPARLLPGKPKKDDKNHMTMQNPQSNNTAAYSETSVAAPSTVQPQNETPYVPQSGQQQRSDKPAAKATAPAQQATSTMTQSSEKKDTNAGKTNSQQKNDRSQTQDHMFVDQKQIKLDVQQQNNSNQQPVMAKSSAEGPAANSEQSKRKSTARAGGTAQQEGAKNDKRAAASTTGQGEANQTGKNQVVTAQKDQLQLEKKQYKESIQNFIQGQQSQAVPIQQQAIVLTANGLSVSSPSTPVQPNSQPNLAANNPQAVAKETPIPAAAPTSTAVSGQQNVHKPDRRQTKEHQKEQQNDQAQGANKQHSKKAGHGGPAPNMKVFAEDGREGAPGSYQPAKHMMNIAVSALSINSQSLTQAQKDKEQPQILTPTKAMLHPAQNFNQQVKDFPGDAAKKPQTNSNLVLHAGEPQAPALNKVKTAQAQTVNKIIVQQQAEKSQKQQVPHVEQDKKVVVADQKEAQPDQAAQIAKGQPLERKPQRVSSTHDFSTLTGGNAMANQNPNTQQAKDAKRHIIVPSTTEKADQEWKVAPERKRHRDQKSNAHQPSDAEPQLQTPTGHKAKAGEKKASSAVSNSERKEQVHKVDKNAASQANNQVKKEAVLEPNKKAAFDLQNRKDKQTNVVQQNQQQDTPTQQQRLQGKGGEESNKKVEKQLVPPSGTKTEPNGKQAANNGPGNINDHGPSRQQEKKKSQEAVALQPNKAKNKEGGGKLTRQGTNELPPHQTNINPLDQVVKLKVQLDDKGYDIVHFTFDLKVDTPENVARELYAEASARPDANRKALSVELLTQKVKRILNEQIKFMRQEKEEREAGSRPKDIDQRRSQVSNQQINIVTKEKPPKLSVPDKSEKPQNDRNLVGTDKQQVAGIISHKDKHVKQLEKTQSTKQAVAGVGQASTPNEKTVGNNQLTQSRDKHQGPLMNAQQAAQLKQDLQASVAQAAAPIQKVRSGQANPGERDKEQQQNKDKLPVENVNEPKRPPLIANNQLMPPVAQTQSNQAQGNQQNNLKHLYKQMNKSIREFFSAVKDLKLADVDAVLDEMNYTEERGHRNSKKEFITQLQHVHRQYIDRSDVRDRRQQAAQNAPGTTTGAIREKQTIKQLPTGQASQQQPQNSQNTAARPVVAKQPSVDNTGRIQQQAQTLNGQQDAAGKERGDRQAQHQQRTANTGVPQQPIQSSTLTDTPVGTQTVATSNQQQQKDGSSIKRPVGPKEEQNQQRPVKAIREQEVYNKELKDQAASPLATRNTVGPTVAVHGASQVATSQQARPNANRLQLQTVSANNEGSSLSNLSTVTKAASPSDPKLVTQLQATINDIKAVLRQRSLIEQKVPQSQQSQELTGGPDLQASPSLTPQEEIISQKTEILAPIAVDGVADEITVMEIRRMQEKLQLEQDGQVSQGLVSKMVLFLDQLKFKNEHLAFLAKGASRPAEQQPHIANNQNQIIPGNALVAPPKQPEQMTQAQKEEWKESVMQSLQSQSQQAKQQQQVTPASATGMTVSSIQPQDKAFKFENEKVEKPNGNIMPPAQATLGNSSPSRFEQKELLSQLAHQDQLSQFQLEQFELASSLAAEMHNEMTPSDVEADNEEEEPPRDLAVMDLMMDMYASKSQDNKAIQEESKEDHDQLDNKQQEDQEEQNREIQKEDEGSVDKKVVEPDQNSNQE